MGLVSQGMLRGAREANAANERMAAAHAASKAAGGVEDLRLEVARLEGRIAALERALRRPCAHCDEATKYLCADACDHGTPPPAAAPESVAGDSR